MEEGIRKYGDKTYKATNVHNVNKGDFIKVGGRVVEIE